MTLFPVVERELRVAARKRSTYWSRVASAVAALAIGGWVLMFSQFTLPQMLGKTLFITLAVVMMVYALQGGMRLTVDCLSEEKREGTLGLLFLTDLKGYDIVFGKLTANSIGSVYALIASFPILAISILLGGVSGIEMFRVSMATLNLLFLSLTLGMFTSAACRDERRSLALAAFLGIAVLGLPPLIGVFCTAKTSASNIVPYLLPSPVYACFMAFESPVRTMLKTADQNFWASMAITHGYSWIFLVLACSIVPRSWQDKSASARRTALQDTLVEVTQGNADDRKSFRTRLLDANPFYWLVARDRFKARLVWIILLILGALWLCGFLYFTKDWLNPGTYIMTTLVLHALLKFWVATEAARRFVDDRRSGAMEWLLCTPMSVSQVLHGQQRGLLFQFGGPAFAVFVADMVLMLGGYFGRDVNQDKTWLSVWIVGTAIYLMDLYALSWLSMWMAMKAQKTNRAAGAALTRVLFLPWLVFGLTLSLGGLLMLTPMLRNAFRNFDPPGSAFAFYWFGLSFVNNVFWILWARKRLHEQFRDIATQRFGSAAKRFGWLRGGKPAPPVIAN